MEDPTSTEQIVPPRQDTTNEASILQTPQREDTFIFRKRDRETPLTASPYGEKRQRINPLSEEEITVGQALGMVPPSRETSASSLHQEQDRTGGGEVSSSSQQREGTKGIKQQFIDIKKRNEPLRVQLYNHLLNMAPTNQQRLMSAFDIQEGKMIMSHFMPTALHPQSASDYLRTNLEVLSKDIHPMDKIELHKQTGEMVYASLADQALDNYRLQNSLNNTASQLELEKASSQAKDNRIRSLEEIIIEIGHDPKDIKGIQEILKLRDADMAALRRKIKLPATIHPQTDEVAQQRLEKDATDLIISLYRQLTQTQEELAKSEAAQTALQATMKQREEGQSSQPPPQVINLEEAATSTVPPPQQTEATAPTTSAPSATEQAQSLNMQKMQDEIRNLEAQMTELNDTRQKLAQLTERHDKSKREVGEKGREIKALKDKIKALENELKLDKIVAEIRAMLWSNIGQTITNQWQYIETIHEQVELIPRAQKEVHRSRASLGNMPELATRMINVLNHKTSSQLTSMGIANRTETIQMIKRVINLRNLVQTLERRVQDMQNEVNRFMEKFQVLENRGLPSLLNNGGKLCTHDQYAKRVNVFASSQVNEKASTSDNTGPITGEIFYKKIENLFFIMNELMHLFDTAPNFYKYTEAEETMGAILVHQLPSPEWWTNAIQKIL